MPIEVLWKKRPCVGNASVVMFFFSDHFFSFRDFSWRDSAFGEKTLAEKMLRIQIGQEAVDSVLATATGRGNCRVCGCQEDGPYKHRLVIIKKQRFIFTAVPSCGRKTVAISLFWSTWKKYRISQLGFSLRLLFEQNPTPVDSWGKNTARLRL